MRRVFGMMCMGILLMAAVAAVAAGGMTAVDYFNRGIDYVRQGDYDKAIADYTKAIELDPTFAKAYDNRGWVYQKKGDYDQAIADETKAIEIDPNFANAYNNRGFDYDHKGDYDKAIADCTKAIELKPDWSWPYVNRGAAYDDKGDYDKAIADYNKAIELKPDDAYAYNNLAWLKATCPSAAYRDGKAAISLAKKALALAKKKDPSYFDTLAAAYAEAGQFDKAVETQQKAIRLLKARNAKSSVIADYEKHLHSYEAHKPWREK